MIQETSQKKKTYAKVERLQKGPLFKRAKDASTSEPKHDPDTEHPDDHFALHHLLDALFFLESCHRVREILG